MSQIIPDPRHHFAEFVAWQKIILESFILNTFAPHVAHIQHRYLKNILKQGFFSPSQEHGLSVEV